MSKGQQTRHRGYLPCKHLMKIRLREPQYQWLYEEAGRTDGWGVAHVLRTLIDDAMRMKETAVQ